MRARASHIFAKERHGHYVEPSWCSARLFEVDKFGPRGSLIYDPACGWGTILRSALDAGYRATGADVVDRLQRRKLKLWGSGGISSFTKADFLATCRRPRDCSIVCNPPFDHVEAFCERALEVAEYKIAMIMLLRRLPAAHWLKRFPLETIYMLTPRPSMPPGSYITNGGVPSGGTQDFVWLVFNKHNHHSVPVVRWLSRDANSDTSKRSMTNGRA
jgi:hypothetical protein